MESNETQVVVTEEIIEATIRELTNLMIKTGDPDFLYDFMVCLFTKPELKDIANRWLLVKEIDKGTTQRDIARKFSLSLCKITRGSKELNKKNSAFRKMLDLLKEIQ